MDRNVMIELNARAISSKVVVLGHIAVIALDLWDDHDKEGRSERFLRRLKDPNTDEGTFIELGNAGDLLDKVLQWIWMPSQPPGSDEKWRVQLDLRQGSQDLAGFPVVLDGDYPIGQKHGTFETWVRFVVKS